MSERRKTPRDLIEEVLDDRAQLTSLSASEIESDVVQLRQLFREVRERVSTEGEADERQAAAHSDMGERRLRYEAVLRPGAYRLRLGGLTFRVMLGEARRTSRILIDAARDLLTPDPAAWGISPTAALATRGAEDQARVEIVQQRGSASGTVIADDTGEEPRVLVVIRGYPADQTAPIMELGEEASEAEGGRVIGVDPEISPEQIPLRPRRQQE
jgi:hypothetical protein